MQDQEFTKIINNIVNERSWINISGSWIKYIKSSDNPGERPEKLSELFPLVDFIREKDFDDYEVAENISSLRSSVFKQGLYLFHKSIHVSMHSENSALNNYPTWTLNVAYQSSVFTAKSIINLLGIASVSIQNKTYIIDLCSDKEMENIKIYKLDINKLEQRHTWIIFITLMKKVKNKNWNAAFNKFKTIDYKHFTKQRNMFFYDDTSWLFNDLHTFDSIDGFGKCKNDKELKRKLKFYENSDFTFVASLFLLEMDFQLFKDISSKTKIIKSELDLINNKIEDGKHPYLNELMEMISES